MSNSKQTTEKTASEQAVLKALGAKPQASAVEIASAAGLGRSTASKVLARLASTGELRRTEGGRDGARRLPDRFALPGAQPVAQSTGPKAAGERLRPGALDGLVLAYMSDHEDDGPFGPGMIAKALQRSAGAVANGLVRLARDNKVRQVGERPLRYETAA